jgi:hypothetical protein
MPRRLLALLCLAVLLFAVAHTPAILYAFPDVTATPHELVAVAPAPAPFDLPADPHVEPATSPRGPPLL